MTFDMTGKVLAPELGQRVVDDLAALNEDFLNLLSDARRHAGASATVLSMPVAQIDAIEGLKAPARKRLTHCAFTLFDLRLDDTPFWSAPIDQRDAVQRPDEFVADAALDKRVGLFTLCALMYLRHLGCINRFLAKLSFGAHDEALKALGAARLDTLQQIVLHCPGLLRCRLGTNADAWTNLVRLARRTDGRPLLPARILGLQHLQ